MKLIVISDCHVLPSGSLSYGLDTGARLAWAVSDINARHGDAGACLLLGDLVDDGKPESYERLREILSRLSVPLHFALGNHDDRSAFRSVFPDAATDANGFLQSVIDIPGARLLVLDSLESGRVSGRLCSRRLAWLDRRLAERPADDAYIFLHHHPCAIDMSVDEVMLEDAEELYGLLSAHRNVRHLFSGHTHRPCSGLWKGIPFATLGSTHYVTEHHHRGTDQAVRRFSQPGLYSVLSIEPARFLLHSHSYMPLEPAHLIAGIDR